LFPFELHGPPDEVLGHPLERNARQRVVIKCPPTSGARPLGAHGGELLRGHEAVDLGDGGCVLLHHVDDAELLIVRMQVEGVVSCYLGHRDAKGKLGERRAIDAEATDGDARHGSGGHNVNSVSLWTWLLYHETYAIQPSHTLCGGKQEAFGTYRD
jgi:hypothetical protein